MKIENVIGYDSGYVNGYKDGFSKALEQF